MEEVRLDDGAGINSAKVVKDNGTFEVRLNLFYIMIRPGACETPAIVCMTSITPREMISRFVWHEMPAGHGHTKIRQLL